MRRKSIALSCSATGVVLASRAHAQGNRALQSLSVAIWPLLKHWRRYYPTRVGPFTLVAHVRKVCMYRELGSHLPNSHPARTPSAPPTAELVRRANLVPGSGELPAESSSASLAGRVLIERVRRILLSELQGGNPSYQTVSDQLQLHPRTLARRLTKAGTRHQVILDSLRRDLALGWLRHRKTQLGEVARALGYATTSSFSRAFTRWTGESANVYRKRHVAPTSVETPQVMSP